MENKSIITMKIIDIDEFLNMKLSTQCLYFHLYLRSDEDGFVGNPSKIMNIIGASEDDLKLLIDKRFVLMFKDGVIVIKHLRVYNALSQNLNYDTQGRFEEFQENETNRQKTNSDKDVIISVSKDSICQEDIQQIMKEWNNLSKFGIKQISRLNKHSNRYDMLTARIKQYSKDDVLTAIEKIKESDYCQGKNKYGWTITFDWFVRPNNFPKVLDGNYDNRYGGINNGQSNRAAKTYSDRILPGKTYRDESEKLF